MVGAIAWNIQVVVTLVAPDRLVVVIALKTVIEAKIAPRRKKWTLRTAAGPEDIPVAVKDKLLHKKKR